MTAPDQNDASGASLPGQAVEAEPLAAREIAASFWDRFGDQSHRDYAHAIRRGRKDDCEAVQIAILALATPVDPNAVKPPEGGEVREAIARIAHPEAFQPYVVACFKSHDRAERARADNHVAKAYAKADAILALASTGTPASKPIASNAAVEREAPIRHGGNVGVPGAGQIVCSTCDGEGQDAALRGCDDCDTTGVIPMPDDTPDVNDGEDERHSKTGHPMLEGNKRIEAALTEPVAPDDGAGA